MARKKTSPAARKYHDRVAHLYDHSYEDAYWRWHDALTWEHIKGFLPRDASLPLLDLGCGTGKWGLKLLLAGYSVTFLDISPKMLDQVRLKIPTRAALDRSRFVRADLADLSALDEGGFSFALALGEPIGCTESPRRALREIHRVLAEGGALVATFDNRLACLDYYFEKGDFQGLTNLLKSGRIQWLTRDREEQFPLQTFTPEQLRSLYEGCGFAVTDLVGKFILPTRRFREELQDARRARLLAAIERKLWRSEAALGRAAHLQIVGKKQS